MSIETPEFGKVETPNREKETHEVESILERGEILSFRELEGYWGIHSVELEGGVQALFRPDEVQDFIFEAKGLDASISGLESLVYDSEKVMEFGLIPPLSVREIGSKKGTIQRRITDSVMGLRLAKEWPDVANAADVRRAAIFDHLFAVMDRGDHNFLVNPETGKLWLIDHDLYMFWRDIRNSVILDHVLKNGLGIIDGHEANALERFLAHVDQLSVGRRQDEIKLLTRAADRAQIILDEGQIVL